jgi:hypothetical protein
MEYYSAINKKKGHEAICHNVSLQGSMLSEVSQKEKYYMISYVESKTQH